MKKLTREEVLAKLKNGEKDFRNLDLSYMDLRFVDFAGANFEGVNFCDTNLSGANFRNSNCANANFSGVNFNGADCKNADFTGANLDFSVLQLSCSLFDFKGDKKLFNQLAYHLCRIDFQDEEIEDVQREVLQRFANQSHIIKKHNLPKINFESEEKR
jgi:uncharacterized protein YjbI with pentapeptide repeats